LLGDDERPSRAVIGQEPALTAWLRAERPGFQAVVHGELGARDATSAALRFLTAMGSCASTLYLHYPNTSTSRAVSPRRKRRFAARRAEGTIETMLPPTRRPIVDDYDARLALVDRQLGRLVRGVSRRGRLDQTLVIVTSDHGTELWDHGRLGATTLYDELLHVPLVIRFPTVGHRRSVEDLVSSVDLVPTIADVAGRSPSDGSDGGSLHQFDRENAPRPIFALATEADAAAAGAVGQAVRTHTAKLIRRLEDGALEFYDLTADPGERQSLAATAPAARSLIGVLDGIRARLAGTGYQLRLRSHAARPLSYVVSFFRRPRAVLIAVDRLTLEQDDRIVLDPDASGLTWRGILEPRGEDQLRFDVLDAAGAFDVHLAFDERTAPADTLRLGKDGVAARLPIELASPTLLGEPSVDVPPLESREATAAFWHVPAGSLADVGAEEPADEAVRERLRELGYID
jgi:hypothetical protein